MRQSLPVTIISIVLFLVSCSDQQDWVRAESQIKDGIHDIEIINNKAAFLYTYGTGKLYKTLNRGRSWQMVYQFDSIYFEQLQFVDRKIGWIAGSPNKLFKTEDGGRTWVDESLNIESLGALVYGLCFKNVSEGYIAIIQSGRNGSISNIYHTDDGGTEWQLVNTINEVILNLEVFQDTLYGSGNNVIIKNIDQKDHWEYSYNDHLKRVGQIRDLEMNSKNQMIAVSFNGYVLKRNENEWVKKRITTNRIRSVIAFGKTWMASGDSNKEAYNLYLSGDDGNEWMASPDQYPDIHRISQSKKMLWVVGKEGLFMTRRK